MTERLTYNLTEAAEALGISRSHVNTLIYSGDLPSLKIGNRRLVTKAALREFLGLPEEAPVSPAEAPLHHAGFQIGGSPLFGMLPDGASVTFSVTIRRIGGVVR